MKSNILKKIIALTYLTIFLFGLFMPLSQTFAQTNQLIVTTDKDTIEKSTAQNNYYIKITARIDDLAIHQNPSGYAEINFSAEPSVTGFNGKANCTANLNNSWSCYANFGSSASGKYIISATTINNVKSNTKEVTVCGTREIVEKGVCVDPLKGIPIVSLSANPTKINLNEQATITATVEKTTGGQIISFGTTGTTYQVSSKTCTIPKTDKEQTSSCSIKFQSQIDSGGFRISALVYANQTDFNKTNSFNIVPFVDVVVEDSSIIVTDENNSTSLVNTDTTYTPLAPLPGLGNAICKDTNGKDVACIETNPKIQSCPFGNYLNIMIKIIIGFAAVLAMVMIVAGGIEYMTSEVVSGKEAGKETITHAILGLLLALGAFLILNTINPQLLSACLDKLPQAVIEIGGDDLSLPFTPITTADLSKLPIYCPGKGGKEELPKIAKSFQGIKVAYSQNPRNVVQGDNLLLDCSSFVKQVYKCAGLDFKGYQTANIFPGTTSIEKIEGTKINGEELQIGSLLGWINGETKYKGGHIIMYIGENKTIEVRHGVPVVTQQSLSYYGNALKHIIKLQ